MSKGLTDKELLLKILEEHCPEALKNEEYRSLLQLNKILNDIKDVNIVSSPDVITITGPSNPFFLLGIESVKGKDLVISTDDHPQYATEQKEFDEGEMNREISDNEEAKLGHDFSDKYCIDPISRLQRCKNCGCIESALCKCESKPWREEFDKEISDIVIRKLESWIYDEEDRRLDVYISRKEMGKLAPPSTMFDHNPVVGANRHLKLRGWKG